MVHCNYTLLFYNFISDYVNQSAYDIWFIWKPKKMVWWMFIF